jgi:hypothetical protein
MNLSGPRRKIRYFYQLPRRLAPSISGTDCEGAGVTILLQFGVYTALGILSMMLGEIRYLYQVRGSRLGLDRLRKPVYVRGVAVTEARPLRDCSGIRYLKNARRLWKNQ